MFFFLSKFLLFLIQPLNWVLGLTIYSLIGKNPKRKRRALRIAVAVLFVISNPITSNILAKMYEAKGVEVAALTSQYDYGIVLGGFANLESPYDNDRLNLNSAANRLSQTVDLYYQGKIKKIILSCGNGSIIGNQENEAINTEAYLKRIGIPEEAIIVDEKARNTYENFKYSKELLNNEGKSARILVITSAFHVPRSRLIAKKAGVQCDFFPTDFYFKDWELTPSNTIIPDDGRVKMWQVIVKEWFGILAYKLKGYI